MKRKIGPLPLWAWTLIAGGTLGLIWYFRSSAGTAAPAPNSGTTSPVLDATAGAPPDASGGGGGSSLGAASGTTLDDLYAGLMNLDTDVKTLQAQGLTDNTGTPQTWAGEFQDVTDAIGALRDTSGLRTDADVQKAKNTARASGVKAGKAAQKKADKKAAAAAAAKKAQKASNAKKKQGSGAAGKKQDKTPARRTQANRAPGRSTGAQSTLNHQAATRQNVHGGNGQNRRTARPKA